MIFNNFFLTKIMPFASSQFLKAIELKDTSQAIHFGMFVCAHLCYMFWINYFGQKLIDNSADVFAQT